VTDMSCAFGRKNDPITASDLADLTFWDTREVTNMSQTFHGAEQFNGKIWTWHTGKVRNMSRMLCVASNFDQDIGSWDTSKVESMSMMFNFAAKFNQDIGSWDTSNVEDMEKMFAYTTEFDCNGRAEWKWDVRKVTNMKEMFYYARNFDRDISDWPVPSNVSMEAMFTKATKLSHADSIIAKWKLTQEQARLAGLAGGAKYGAAFRGFV
jgi:surface protein